LLYNSYYNELYSGMGSTWDGTTTGVLFTDRRDFYIDPYEMAFIYASVAPFTAFGSQLPVVESNDPDFKMFEHDDHFVDQKFLVDDADGAAWSASGAVGAEATIAGADNATAIALGDNLEGLEVEIRDSTGDLKSIALITTYNAGAITFKHISNPEESDNAADAIVDNDIVYVIGNMRAEGSRSPSGWSTQPRTFWNSCQIQKTPLKISGTLLKAALRGWSSELERLRVMKGHEHAIQKERSKLFGARADGNDAPSTSMLVDADGEPIRSTLGIVPALNRYGTATGDYKNIFTITASSYDYDTFLDDSANWFKFMPEGGKLTLMGGLGLVNFFHKIGTNGFLGNSGASVQIGHRVMGGVGYAFTEFYAPAGTIELVYNPLFKYGYTDWGILLDKTTIQRVQYRSDEYQAAIQENDADYVKDQYFSDDGVKITNLHKNALLKLA